MLDNQTLKVVIWVIAGIVGLLLALSRMKTGKLDWKIGIGISLGAVALFVLATELPQYGIGFSIVGTLILAGVALMAIKQTNEQVRGDRRERRLIAIITWANDIAKCETEIPLTPLPVVELLKSLPELGEERARLIFEYRDRNIRTNLIMRYQNLEAMRTRVVLMAHRLDEQLGRGSNLGSLAEQTSDKLQKHVELGEKFIPGEITDSEYHKHWKLLVDSAIALAEKAEEATD